MSNIQRLLNIQIPPGQSAFLWGPRKTGKSTYLKEAFPDSLYFDFLKTDLALELTKRPSLFRERLLAMSNEDLIHPIIIDEVQKVPRILDEVHWLIENRNLSFVLCGSSARKLKRGQANLLGGRAWRYEMFPFVSAEVTKFELRRALNHGMIPDHYLKENLKKSLQGYIQDYLKEEVFDEGLIRNIPAFARFFDAVGYSHGEMVNYSNIARDSGADAKTVREYFQILVDTLMGRFVEPFKRQQFRQVITKAPKFYLFDVGVAGALTRRHIPEERGVLFGKAFEHFVFMEIVAYSSYHELHFPIRYWRTKSGYEVDFILGDAEVAVEVKSSTQISRKDMRPLLVFSEEFHPRQAYLVCNESEERQSGKVRIIPWARFLDRLWEGKIIT